MQRIIHALVIASVVFGCCTAFAESIAPLNLVGLKTVKYTDKPQVIMAKIIERYEYRLNDSTALYLAECQGQDIVIHAREKADVLDSTRVVEKSYTLRVVDPDTLSVSSECHGSDFRVKEQIHPPVNHDDKASVLCQSGVSKIEKGKTYLFLVEPTELWDDLIDLFPYSVLPGSALNGRSYDYSSTLERLKKCKGYSFRALNLVGNKVYPIGL